MAMDAVKVYVRIVLIRESVEDPRGRASKRVAAYKCPAGPTPITFLTLATDKPV
jgi:hypothetical protein